MATKFFQSDSDPNLPARQLVLDMALNLGAGQYASRECPACEGGTSHERTMSLDIGTNGIVKFYCHRASCDFNGSLYAGGPLAGKSVLPASGVEGRTAKPLLSDIHALSDHEKEWFLERFCIDTTNVVYRTETRYALPLYRPDGSRRGYITRRPWDGSPADTETNRNDFYWSSKALTYLDNTDDTLLSWYTDRDGHTRPLKGILAVEDPISAVRAATVLKGYRYVSLLGTALTVQKVAELQKFKAPLILALDADATGQAFAMARKWGSAFQSCRVVVLRKDIKDSTNDEIKELPL